MVRLPAHVVVRGDVRPRLEQRPDALPVALPRGNVQRRRPIGPLPGVLARAARQQEVDAAPVALAGGEVEEGEAAALSAWGVKSTVM